MSDETRVVLVKPGDVLVFGGLGEHDEFVWAQIQQMSEILKARFGLAEVMWFSADIDMDVVPAETLTAMASLRDATFVPRRLCEPGS